MAEWPYDVLMAKSFKRACKKHMLLHVSRAARWTGSHRQVLPQRGYTPTEFVLRSHHVVSVSWLPKWAGVWLNIWVWPRCSLDSIFVVLGALFLPNFEGATPPDPALDWRVLTPQTLLFQISANTIRSVWSLCFCFADFSGSLLKGPSLVRGLAPPLDVLTGGLSP